MMKMKNLVALTGLALTMFQSGAAMADRPSDCMRHLRNSGCALSGNDTDRIDDNVKSCEHVRPTWAAGGLEIFLLRDSGKVVTVDLEDCSRVKYTIDTSGIDKIVESRGNVYMLSDDGEVYYMDRFKTVHELLNAKKKPYKSVQNIVDNGDTITLVGKTFTYDYDLAKRIEEHKTRTIRYYPIPTNRSLFRDE